ncbi:unnamed protein product [Danaus chrysippus]|uniref:(African queen) hypothetical protein n=1 Tax=Danaus chrysippus TaxID=151541 RepID=A0A8J2R487_9NEOP|nr:unnamed protein product [Danaus chrysippus]
MWRIFPLLLCFYAVLSSGTSSDDDRRWLVSLIDLVELDYQDQCNQRAEATWEELLGKKKILSLNLCYILTSIEKLHNSIAREQDEEKLRLMKASWDSHLPDFKEYLNKILPLQRNVSKESHSKQSIFMYVSTVYDSAEEYWNSLAECEGAMLTAPEIWDHVRPLYLKLHKYVSLKLKGVDEVGKPLPIYLLKESAFNGTYPPIIVDWCESNRMRFVTCKDVSIQNYMDAHETAMKIKYKITTSLHSNNTYVLRGAPRCSAIYEAVPRFVSLLPLNPHTLEGAGLYPLNRFHYNQNHNRLVLLLIIALRDLSK